MSYFPDVLKSARFVAIFKSNDRLILNNYLTVSLPSLFIKIFDKHLCKHFSNCPTQKKILCEQQRGSMNGLSTEISVAKLLKHVHDGLDANKF